MGALITSSSPESVYQYQGVNMAPLEPLAQLTGRGDPTWDESTFCDAILQKYNDYKQRDYQSYYESVNIGRMVANLREGKLLLLRSAVTNAYVFVKPDGKYQDNKTIGGLFQFYSTKLTAEWLSSRPERDPVITSTDDQIEEYFGAVKIVQDSYDRKFFDIAYEQRESLSAQDYGMWITRFRYDPVLKDIVMELLPYPACRWDVRFTPEESSHFIYESKCPTSTLKHILRADISSDDTFPDQYGLQIIEQLARQGGNVAGQGKERPFGQYDIVDDENVVTEMWLQPEAYADIELTKDEGTIGGYPLKKGGLLEMFPNGMCVVGIQGMKTIIGVYAENHKDHIVSGFYHVQSFSGRGKGVSDAVDVMKEMNDLHSQTMAYIKAHGTPAWYYNQDLISEQDAKNIGKPRKMIPVDFKNAPEGVTSINQAVQAIIPGNPANSVFQYGQSLNNWLQMSFQVTTFSDGMPGVNNTTATGAQIGEANERMMLVPQHRNKADHRKRADKVIFNLFRKYVDTERFFSTRDKNALTRNKSFSNQFFQNAVDIDFEIIADSEIPKTRFTQELATTKLLQIAGGPLGLAQAKATDAELTAAICQAFGVDLPITQPNEVARVCRQRIQNLKELFDGEMQLQRMMSSISGEMVDNSQLGESLVAQLSYPVSPAEPDIQQKVGWLSRFLDSDEAKFAPVDFRHCVEALILAHIEQESFGQGMMGLAAQAGQAMALAPQLQIQQAMGQQQAQQEAEKAAQDAENQSKTAVAQATAQSQGQMEIERLKAQVQAQQSDAQFERDMVKDKMATEKEVGMEAMKLAAQAEEKALDRTAQSKRGYPVGRTSKKSG